MLTARGVSELPDFVKPAFLRLKSLELSWLRGLSNSLKKKLSGGTVKEFDSSLHHLRSYGEFVFTLAGIKPCVLICHCATPAYAEGLVNNCIKPLIDQFALDTKGFELHRISHTMYTTNPIHPGFKGGYIFANRNHPLYNLVRETFLVPHATPIDELQIGTALGYPLPYGESQMSYMDATESEEQDTCCVPMLEYTCGAQGGFEDIIKHFQQHAEVWQQLGRKLTIDTEDHPVFRAWLDRIKSRAAAATMGAR